jgi:hypothetical protein
MFSLIKHALIIVLSVVVFTASIHAQDCCIGIRGNIDNSPDQQISITDLVFLVDYMFQGGPAPACPEETDVDGSGGLDIADMVYLVTFMFQGGPSPAACPGTEPDSVILPLAVGNQLVSHYTEYNPSGQVTETGTSTSTVVGDSVIGDTLWYLVEDTYDGVDTSLWANFDDGAWSVVDTASPPEQLMLKYPATVGDTYGYDQITVHVDDLDASVTVPAGTFTCYYYRVTVPVLGTIAKIWAAPNIGVVKAEQYDLYLFSMYLKVRFELESYTIQE